MGSTNSKRSQRNCSNELIAEKILAGRIEEKHQNTITNAKIRTKIVVSLTDPLLRSDLINLKQIVPYITVQTMVAQHLHHCQLLNAIHESVICGTLIPMIDKTQPIVDKKLIRVLPTVVTSPFSIFATAYRKIDLISPPPSSKRSGSARLQVERIRIHGRVPILCPVE